MDRAIQDLLERFRKDPTDLKIGEIQRLIDSFEGEIKVGARELAQMAEMQKQAETAKAEAQQQHEEAEEKLRKAKKFQEENYGELIAELFEQPKEELKTGARKDSHRAMLLTVATTALAIFVGILGTKWFNPDMNDEFRELTKRIEELPKLSTQPVSSNIQVVHIGEKFTGERYLRLDQNGNPIESSSYEEKPWDCVLDKKTGLMWEVKTTDGWLRDQYHDYTWYNPDMSSNGGHAGREEYDKCRTNTPCNISAYAISVNKSGVCGKNDWRMPTIDELWNLSDRSHVTPKLDENYFPNTVIFGKYWSASVDKESVLKAWSIHFNGDAYNSYKASSYKARLVRDGE